MPGTHVDPAASFKYKVEITGIGQSKFTECSGIGFKMNTGTPVKEAGLNSYAHVLPGPVEVNNVTLKRGVSTDGTALWNWVKKTVSGQITVHDITIHLMALDGTEIQAWTFLGAFPVKWSASQITSQSSQVVIEEFEFAHQGLDLA